MSKIYDYSILVGSLTFFIIFPIYFLNNVFGYIAERGEIQDNSDDWYSYNIIDGQKNKTHILESDIKKQNNGSLIGNIDSVGYISNGKTLNITIWLSKENKNPSSFNSSFFKVLPKGNNVIYGMYIDADSDVNTGRKGADYAINFIRNSSTNQWTPIFEEISSSDHLQILNSKDKINCTFSEKNGYVLFSLDLNSLNFPEKFLFTSYIEYFLPDKQIWDFTNWESFPKPQYSITPTTNSITLRPAEIKHVGFSINNINTLTRVPPIINLKLNNSYPNDIDLNFVPSNTSLQNNISSLSTLYIDAFTSASPHDYSIPINETISFPAQYLGNPIENVTKSSSYTITILPTLSQEEQFTNFVNAWVTPLNTLWGLLIAVGGASIPIIIRLYKKIIGA